MSLAQKLQDQTTKRNLVDTNLFGIKEEIFDAVRQEVNKMKDEITQELRRILEEKIGVEGLTTLKGERGYTPQRNVDYLTPKEMTQLKKELKGKDGRTGISGRDGRDGLTQVITKDGSPDSPEQIAEKINTLEERIEQKTIKGLALYLHNLNRSIREKAGSGGGDSVSVYDLTGETNGTLKTFTVPAHITGKTMVYSTQFPGIYRPTVDFTETSTSITLTSAVGAPEANQTLLVYYVRG